MPSDNVVWVFVIVLLLIIVLTVGVNFERRRARQKRQLIGLQWLASLRALLSHVQKHRGLTTGYLGGSTELATDIENLQRNVSRDLSAISSIDAAIEDNSRWQGVTQHWARLSGNYQSADRENNLSQHNHLIKNILYLIDDLAQEYDLLHLRNGDNKPMHLYWRELLSAAEYIGQARAIGTGVAAAGNCDSVSRIRLNYLCQKIEANVGHLWREIGQHGQQETKIRSLLDSINNKLIGEQASIAATEYFNLATDALDSLLEQFDQLIKEQQWR